METSLIEVISFWIFPILGLTNNFIYVLRIALNYYINRNPAYEKDLKTCLKSKKKTNPWLSHQNGDKRGKAGSK